MFSIPASFNAGFEPYLLPFITTLLISSGSYGTFFALFRRIFDTDIIFLFVWFVSETNVIIGFVSKIWAVLAKWSALDFCFVQYSSENCITNLASNGIESI